MIPAPKLDDRAYDDLVAEALRLIPRYCPDWTNHNPSDPGITILELAAWMTDVILYRLNRVPEKNYIAFLNLLGIKLRAPQPAHALLQFGLVEGAEKALVREGTAVATPSAADEDTVVFETVRDLLVTKVKLDRCFSYQNENYSDNSRFLIGGAPDGFEAFGGADRVDRYLYLGDPRFQSVGDGAVLFVHLGCPETGARDLARLLEWEYFDGKRWRELNRLTQLDVERGEIAFAGPAPMQPTTLFGIEDTWIRGRLAEVPQNPQETEIDTIRTRMEVVGEGVPPDAAFANLDNNAYLQLDLGKNMFPFGKEPKIDHCFYVGCTELMKQPEAEVRIEVVLSEGAVAPPPNPSEDLTIVFEYFDGKKWRPLGVTGPKGPRPGAGEEFGFNDETRAFTKAGVISFRRPKDMVISDVSGVATYWVRARIELGDFGLAGNYLLDGDRWVWRDDRPLRPPAVRSLGFKYREEYKDPKHCLSYNDFKYRDLTHDAKTEFTLFQPFLPVVEESASLYLGFDGKLPNDMVSLYFHMQENVSPLAGLDANTANIEHLRAWMAQREAQWEAEQRVVWEYYHAGQWSPLVVRDSTKNFTQSGFIDFVGPDDMGMTMKFTEDRYWIRARLEMGGYARPPRVLRILHNVVEAMNVVSVRDEVLGSSDGTPLQTFQLAQGPLLEGEVIEVLEREAPHEKDLEDLVFDATPGGRTPQSSERAPQVPNTAEGTHHPAVRLVPEDQNNGVPGYWVRYKPVDSFFDSKPRSRHYKRDHITGKISFGDGARGMLPPEGRNNVIARRYQVGGGVQGNVNAGTLTALTKSIAYIEGVTNPLPAGGGANGETVDEAKGRAPHVIKSRDRAVTAEDYEMLALRASTGVARAKCIPSPTNPGEVVLILLPRVDDKHADLTKKLVPSPELLRYVKQFMDDRRLVGTTLEVVRPRYVEFSIKVTTLRRSVGTSDRLRRDIEERTRRYLHSLVGGRDGKGWVFGRAVLKSDLVNLVEGVAGVEAVDNIQIFDEDNRVTVEQVRLAVDQLPHLVSVSVVEKVRDEIA